MCETRLALVTTPYAPPVLKRPIHPRHLHKSFIIRNIRQLPRTLSSAQTVQICTARKQIASDRLFHYYSQRKKLRSPKYFNPEKQERKWNCSKGVSGAE